MVDKRLTTTVLKQELALKKGGAKAPPVLSEGNIDPLLSEVKSDLREAGVEEGDPLDKPFEGLIRVAGELSSAIRDLSDARETVMGSVRGAVDEEVEHGRARIAEAEEVSLKRLRASAVGELARVKWGLAASVGCVLSGLVLVSAGASYWLGWSQSRSSYRVTETSIAAAFRHGPEAAAKWQALMERNNIVRVLEQCQGAALRKEGDGVWCAAPLWVDGVP